MPYHQILSLNYCNSLRYNTITIVSSCQYYCNSLLETSHRQLDKLLYSRYYFCKTGRKTMLELQCPVRKSKQFGGRSKTESHTRSERQLRMRVWLFPLLNRKEASLVTRGGLPAPTPQGLTPKSGAFWGKAGIAVLPDGGLTA